MRSLFLTLFVLACAGVGACTTLGAPAPLFSTADQIGPAPLREGVWIALNSDCPAANAQRRSGRFPNDCAPTEIRRQEDGAWLVTFRADLMRAPAESDAPRTPTRVIIVPAIEQPAPDAFAPLYVGQFAPDPAHPDVIFFGMAPVGAMPAAAFVYVDMSCTSILRDGPVAGVALVERAAEPAPEAPANSLQLPAQDCVASTQAGVREAARRALIERFSSIAESGERLVLVRER